MMRAPRAAARLYLLTAALLVLAPPGPAVAQPLAPADLHAALERVARSGWHPMLTDPEWIAVRAALDRELAAAPQSELADHVRQAAVRIEVGVSPLVSHDARSATLAIDTRPWISTAVALPYFVELYASIDGGEWALVATADSGATCDARVLDVAWPAPVPLGFHHVELLADVYHLARPHSAGAPRCGIRRGDTPARAAEAPAAPRGSMPPPTREGIALSHERRTLPGVSFGLLDTSPQARPRVAGARGEPRWNRAPGPGSLSSRVGTEPEYSIFIRQAQRVPARALDERLPAIPFERWLRGAIKDMIADAPPWWWIPPDFCNVDEGLWYRGRGPSGTEEAWTAASELRRRPRAICATAVVSVATGVLTVRLRVGTIVEDTGEWRLETPALYEAFVEGGPGDLDIPSLEELPRLARLPADAWPRPDIVVSLSPLSSPAAAVAAGQPVRLEIRIQNIGAHDAHYVHGTLAGGCEDRPRQFFDVLASVAAGDTVTIERSMAPSGPSICAGIVLFVYAPAGLGGGIRTEFGDAFPDDNLAVFLFGPAPR